MIAPAPQARLKLLPWAALAGLHEDACQAIALVLSGQAAERVIDRLLRDRRTLDREQRTALVEAVFGVALWRRLLASLTNVNDNCQPQAARILLFAFLRDLCGREPMEAARLSGLPQAALPERREVPHSLALRWSLPDWIADVVSRELGAEAEAFCAAINQPGPICLRVNPLRCSRDELRERLATEGVATSRTRFSPLGLLVEGPRPNLLGLLAQRDGWFEVQDEGSQLLGLLVEAAPGRRVLDFCAGAGGKTLLLAGELRGEGELHAHDVDSERLERLQRRAARAGAARIEVHRSPPPGSLLCDRVLVDAPCSELGVLRRGPDARFRIAAESARALPALQAAILARAAGHVRPGGRLIYATCTLRHEENEEVVRAFLHEDARFSLRPAGAGWLHEGMRRGDLFFCLPHLHGTDGFFAAVLERH